MSNRALSVIRYLIGVIVLGTTGLAVAQTLPRAFDASPDIYKVIAEDDKYLVVEATYKPGQRSKSFSSPAYLYYLVSDCHLRKHYPDGQVVDNGPGLAGLAAHAPGFDSAAFENVGKNTCRIVTFAPK
jgi:beta-alanine degradation protein BauB